MPELPRKKVDHLRQSLLPGDDEVRLTPLEHHPGGGLHPDPGAALGEQPEDTEAAFASFYHCVRRQNLNSCTILRIISLIIIRTIISTIIN